jgi:hypothetical protein
MAPAPTFDELIATVQADADSDEALDRLATAAVLVGRLSETGDAVLGYFVDEARSAGQTWVEISSVLGVTRQAVHKRFAAGEPGDRPSLRRFTERTRRAIEAADAIARAFRHDSIGTEHLLLGLFAVPGCLAAEILDGAGAGRDVVTAAVGAIYSHGAPGTALPPQPPDPGGPTGGDRTGVAPRLPFSPRGTDALTRAAGEATELGHAYVGTEHILLAFYGDPESVAERILGEVGPDETTARAAIAEALAHPRR